MTLTDLLGNKMRAFVFGAALTACGGEPETKYVVVDGQETETNTCEEAAAKLVYCKWINQPEDMLSDCYKLLSEDKEGTEAGIACVIATPCDALEDCK